MPVCGKAPSLAVSASQSHATAHRPRCIPLCNNDPLVFLAGISVTTSSHSLVGSECPPSLSPHPADRTPFVLSRSLARITTKLCRRLSSPFELELLLRSYASSCFYSAMGLTLSRSVNVDKTDRNWLCESCCCCTLSFSTHSLCLKFPLSFPLPRCILLFLAFPSYLSVCLSAPLSALYGNVLTRCRFRTLISNHERKKAWPSFHVMRVIDRCLFTHSSPHSNKINTHTHTHKETRRSSSNALGVVVVAS